jgi:hypothetical protein
MSNTTRLAMAAVFVAGTCAGILLLSTLQPTAAQEDTPDSVTVLWTSGDPEVAHRVCLMYTHASANNDWFDEVRLIVWGPSARLLAADKDLQAKVKTMMEDGVLVQACIVCADSYGVTETLRGLDIEVKAMGMPLTEILKSDSKVITF